MQEENRSDVCAESERCMVEETEGGNFQRLEIWKFREKDG